MIKSLLLASLKLGKATGWHRLSCRIVGMSDEAYRRTYETYVSVLSDSLSLRESFEAYTNSPANLENGLAGLLLIQRVSRKAALLFGDKGREVSEKIDSIVSEATRILRARVRREQIREHVFDFSRGWYTRELRELFRVARENFAPDLVGWLSEDIQNALALYGARKVDLQDLQAAIKSLLDYLGIDENSPEGSRFWGYVETYGAVSQMNSNFGAAC